METPRTETTDRVVSEGAATAPAADGVRTFALSRALFIRLLGVVYVCAFASMWMQVRGLFGARGILPAGEFLAAAREQLGSAAYWRVPTLFWLGSGDGALAALCAAGTVLAALLVIGVAPLPLLAALWAMYLSIVSIGQDFLSFQWDSLLLEAGFLAIFFAPLRLALRRARHDPPSAAIRWLILWLLFRLMFSSGMVKLLSGDPTWRDLTAMSYHYETQPIPAWTSWYVQQFPPACHKAEVLVTFFLELIVPFMIFGPRVVRRAAFVLLGGLQMLIMATGNFGFFNLLTMALAVPLLDDAVFSRWWRGSDDASKLESNPGRARWALTGGSIALGMLSLVPFSSSLGLLELVPRPMVRAYVHTRPLGLSSPYGLFAVMTTRRPELIIEGSNDGTRWLAYEFKYKPGDVKRRPPLIGPHMPRLDWQMWFAALGGYERTPWLAAFLERLKEASPDVIGLLERNPFPDGPPRELRVRVEDYRFTDRATRRHTGAWWHTTRSPDDDESHR